MDVAKRFEESFSQHFYFFITNTTLPKAFLLRVGIIYKDEPHSKFAGIRHIPDKTLRGDFLFCFSFDFIQQVNRTALGTTVTTEKTFVATM